MNLDGFKRNVKGLDMFVAAGLVYLLWLLYVHLTLDINDYFIVHKVQVSDYVHEKDGRVLYDRDIKQAFWAGWTANVKSTTSDVVVCPAHGHHEYIKGEEKKKNGKDKTLKWYLERTCNLPPGEYFINTTWELENGLSLSNTSNVFRVYSQAEWDALPPAHRRRERGG